jgi:hypothetical protein
MPRCARCRRSYRGEEPYCEPCEEYKGLVHREAHGVVCLHCGKQFSPGSFDRHRWRVYYRDHFRPKGVRR